MIELPVVYCELTTWGNLVIGLPVVYCELTTQGI